MGVARTKAASVEDASRCRVAYMADLARGSSHISSALSEKTREAAITEVATDFETHYGRRDLLIFIELLAHALDERKNPVAALAVRTRFDVRKPGRQPKAASVAA